MKAAKEEKEGEEDKRYLLFWGFVQLLCNKECLPRLLKKSHVSQIRHWKALVIFMVEESKVGLVVSSGRFFYNVCFAVVGSLSPNMAWYQAARPNQHMFTASGCMKEGPFNSMVKTEVRLNFPFTQGPPFFPAHTSCQRLLGIFTLPEFTLFYYSLFYPIHTKYLTI